MCRSLSTFWSLNLIGEFPTITPWPLLLTRCHLGGALKPRKLWICWLGDQNKKVKRVAPVHYEMCAWHEKVLYTRYEGDYTYIWISWKCDARKITMGWHGHPAATLPKGFLESFVLWVFPSFRHVLPCVCYPSSCLMPFLVLWPWVIIKAMVFGKTWAQILVRLPFWASVSLSVRGE